METLTTGSPLTDQLTKALGNTLMHSLWQGVLLALAGGLIIIFTKKLSAALRYNLLIGAMLLFTFGTLFTFFLLLKPAQTSHLVYKGDNPVVNSQVFLQATATPTNYIDKQSITDTLIGYLNAHCNTIVLIWFLIICAKSIKLAVGGYEVYHLKHTNTYTVSKYWESRLTYLSSQLGIKQAIRLVESGMAKVPMVIGHLKPLILIPVGFINALSADEVEAILIHELAHIRRRDYLVNLLQSFMEIVFFFNPAVLWISQLIKAERENCCDDIALKQAGSKANYVQALLSCQEYQLLTPNLSMALTGNKSKLLNRVKRIVNNHNQSLNIMEKTLLTICMVTAGLFTLAFSAKENKNIPAKVSVATHQQTKEHTISVDPKVGYVFKLDNKSTYKFNKTGSQITDLKVNGKAVPNSQVKKYAPQIDALLKQNEQAKQEELNQRPATASDTSKAPGKIYNPADFNDGTTMNVRESKDGKAMSSYLFKRNGVLYQVFMNHRKAYAIYIDGKQKPVADYQSKIDELVDEYADITQPVPPAAPVPPVASIGKIASPRAAPAIAAMPSPNAIAMVAPSVPLTPPVKALGATAQLASPVPNAPLSPAPMVSVTPMVAPMAPLAPVKPDVSFVEATNELVKDGIIKDKNNFDINITNEVLVVDGVKQSEAVHQRFLKKFVKKPGDKINWHYSNHN